MTQFAVKCGCGRTMNPDGRTGRNHFRCGCGARIQVADQRSEARRCTYGECRTLATTAEPLRFCPEHEELAAIILGRIAGSAELREFQELLPMSPDTWSRRKGYKVTPLPPTTDRPSVVYFARRERLIKIGTTVRLRIRMSSLATSVLATEPGDIVRESQLKNQFNHLLAVGREWFHPGVDLVAYVNELRAADGMKAISA